MSAAPGGDALDTLVLRGSGNGGAYTGLHQDAFLNNYLYSLDVGCQYNQPVVLYLEDEKKKLAAPRRLYTSGHPLFYQELQRLLGADNVATK